MAPTLRSSPKATGQQELQSVTPRKTPICTKCKRPRAGHPRSGCPYTDSPTKTGKVAAERNTDNVVDALRSMQLQSPVREQDDDRAAIRQRRRLSQHAADLVNAQSMASLDTASQEVMEKLLQPGMFDDLDRGRNATAKVVQWKDTLTPTRAARNRVKMPCSLYSPSPSSSQASIKLETMPPASSADIDDQNDDTGLPPDPTSSKLTFPVEPLSRSMSVEERKSFLCSLNNTSDATVYRVPRDDIHSIHADAIRVGFHARIILGKDTRDPQGLLILGHNEDAVRRLYEQVEVERKKSIGFRTAAAGAVVGAVGAFAGLAFT